MLKSRIPLTLLPLGKKLGIEVLPPWTSIFPLTTKTKSPVNSFLVKLMRVGSYANIYELASLIYFRVQVLAFNASLGTPQCFNCQRYKCSSTPTMWLKGILEAANLPHTQLQMDASSDSRSCITLKKALWNQWDNVRPAPPHYAAFRLRFWSQPLHARLLQLPLRRQLQLPRPWYQLEPAQEGGPVRYNLCPYALRTPDHCSLTFFPNSQTGCLCCAWSCPAFHLPEVGNRVAGTSSPWRYSATRHSRFPRNSDSILGT